MVAAFFWVYENDRREDPGFVEERWSTGKAAKRSRRSGGGEVAGGVEILLATAWLVAPRVISNSGTGRGGLGVGIGAIFRTYRGFAKGVARAMGSGTDIFDE